MNTLTELSHTLFKLDEIDSAKIVLKKAKASVQYYKDYEFKSRCKFIEGVYIKSNLEIVDEAMNELIEAHLFF